MSYTSKVSVPPQYTTCLAWGSVGAASAGAISAIAVIEDVEGYIKEDGLQASKIYKLEVPIFKVVELD